MRSGKSIWTYVDEVGIEGMSGGVGTRGSSADGLDA